MGMSRHTWGAVAPLVAAETTTVVYDRSGLGRSPATATPRDVAHLADDLLDVLATLGTGPFVLVGHSWGGPIIRQAAATAAPETVGRPRARRPERRALRPVLRTRQRPPGEDRRGGGTGAGPARILRLMMRRLAAPLPEPAASGLRLEDSTPAAARAQLAEMEHSIDDLRRLRDDPPLMPDVPVTVISGTVTSWFERHRRPALVAAHQATATAYPQGRHASPSAPATTCRSPSPSSCGGRGAPRRRAGRRRRLARGRASPQAEAVGQPAPRDRGLRSLEPAHGRQARRRRQQGLAREEPGDRREVHVDGGSIGAPSEWMGREHVRRWRAAVEVQRREQTDQIDPGRATRRAGPVDEDVTSRAAALRRTLSVRVSTCTRCVPDRRGRRQRVERGEAFEVAAAPLVEAFERVRGETDPVPAEPAMGIGEGIDAGEVDAVRDVRHPVEHTEEPRPRRPDPSPPACDRRSTRWRGRPNRRRRRHRAGAAPAPRREHTEHDALPAVDRRRERVERRARGLEEDTCDRRPGRRRTAGPGEKPPATSCVATTGDPSTASTSRRTVAGTSRHAVRTPWRAMRPSHHVVTQGRPDVRIAATRLVLGPSVRMPSVAEAGGSRLPARSSR